MDNAFRRALAKRGAVFLIHNVEFANKIMPKFCVLMENYYDGAENILIIFATSRMDYKRRKTSVIVTDFSGFTEDTLIQCENFKLIDPSILLQGKHSVYKGQFSDVVMAKIDEAITNIQGVEEEIIFRMVE